MYFSFLLDFFIQGLFWHVFNFYLLRNIVVLFFLSDFYIDPIWSENTLSSLLNLFNGPGYGLYSGMFHEYLEKYTLLFWVKDFKHINWIQFVDFL